MTVFRTYSLGLATGRDAWAYNFSQGELGSNITRMIDYYNKQVDGFAASRLSESPVPVDRFVDHDPTKISWNRNAKSDLSKGKHYAVDASAYRSASYRPFTKVHVYFDRQINAMTYQLPKMFPTGDVKNVGFYILSLGAVKPFSVMMVDEIPDLNFYGSEGGQFFPRYTYIAANGAPQLGDESGEDNQFDGYRRIDNITDAIHSGYRSVFGPDVTKDDVFHYAYGVLHSPDYRSEFAADLRKTLPRIPKVDRVEDFRAFASAGRALSDLHVGYETVEPYPLQEIYTSGVELAGREAYRVKKIRFRSKNDRTSIVYNGSLTLAGIPDEAHGYMLGSRSAIEWIIDRYQFKTDKASGIVNNPNDWCDEHDDPRYIVDLIKRVDTANLGSPVSVNDGSVAPVIHLYATTYKRRW